MPIEFWQNALLIALVTGVLGSRLSHVLENLDLYTDPTRGAWANLVAAADITSGGLTFYGGLILAAVCLIGYALFKKVPLRNAMDAGAPAIIVGLAFGRIGCFLHGCCEGQICHLPWAVRFPYGSLPYAEQAAAGRLDVPAALVRDGRLVPPAQAASDPMLAQLADAAASLPLQPDPALQLAQRLPPDGPAAGLLLHPPPAGAGLRAHAAADRGQPVHARDAADGAGGGGVVGGGSASAWSGAWCCSGSGRRSGSRSGAGSSTRSRVRCLPKRGDCNPHAWELRVRG